MPRPAPGPNTRAEENLMAPPRPAPGPNTRAEENLMAPPRPAPGPNTRAEENLMAPPIYAPDESLFSERHLMTMPMYEPRTGDANSFRPSPVISEKAISEMMAILGNTSGPKPGTGSPPLVAHLKGHIDPNVEAERRAHAAHIDRLMGRSDPNESDSRLLKATSTSPPQGFSFTKPPPIIRHRPASPAKYDSDDEEDLYSGGSKIHGFTLKSTNKKDGSIASKNKYWSYFIEKHKKEIKGRKAELKKTIKGLRDKPNSIRKRSSKRSRKHK